MNLFYISARRYEGERREKNKIERERERDEEVCVCIRKYFIISLCFEYYAAIESSHFPHYMIPLTLSTHLSTQTLYMNMCVTQTCVLNP